MASVGTAGIQNKKIITQARALLLWISKQSQFLRSDIASFNTWLLSIARNVGTDHLRARRRVVPLDEAAAVASLETPEDDLARRADADRLALLLQELTDRDRELIALKYGAGLTNRAIAQATGLSESNVGTILYRAVHALRARW